MLKSHTAIALIGLCLSSVAACSEKGTTSMKDVFWSQQKMVAQALLIKRLGAEAKGAELLSWQKVTWRNGALGCPKPGVSYTQQLINGVTMNWQLHGQVYVLHGNDKGGLFLCNRQPEKPYRIGWQGSEIIVE